jgi:hypothetical protein
MVELWIVVETWSTKHISRIMMLSRMLFGHAFWTTHLFVIGSSVFIIMNISQKVNTFVNTLVTIHIDKWVRQN